jgi:hypothetical protein
MKIARVSVVAVSLSIAPAASVLADDVARPTPAIPFPTSAGSLTLQMDAQGNTLVVADAVRQSLAVYRIDGSQVRLVGVRNLDRDFSGETTKEPSPAPLPGKDVPGQDPPDFVRPPNAVRAFSEYMGDIGPHEQWNTFYVAPGSITDVFGKLRAALKGWKLASESGGGSGPSRLKVVKDKTSIEMNVGAIPTSPGWVEIHATEIRQKS